MKKLNSTEAELKKALLLKRRVYNHNSGYLLLFGKQNLQSFDILCD